MNDFDYDVLQKKRVARGAAHMKRGSKSKKCALPSDGMTEAEWKRRNGPVATYKLDAPMRWDDFKAMPEDLQKRYLLNLRELYDANDRMIGEMFFVHLSTVSVIRNKLGITGKMPVLYGEEAERRDAKWAAFCNGVVGGGDVEKSVEETPEVTEKSVVKLDPMEEVTPAEAPETEGPIRFDSEESAEKAMELIQEPIFTPVEVAEKPKLALTDLTAIFKGEFDGETFLKWLSQFPIPEGYVKIRVEVTTPPVIRTEVNFIRNEMESGL